jgi:putative endonuclease
MSFLNTALRSIKDMAQNNILKHFGFTALVATIVGRFSRSLNCPCQLIGPDGVARDRIWLGTYGENVATDWLRARGYRILARNFRGPKRGEVDIVARDGRLLLFIEVKTRQVDSRIRGLDAVNRKKQELIERGANEWLKKLRTRNLPWCFDVIEVYTEEGSIPRVNHVKDAF